jgi:hypothetical protein
VKIDVVEQSHAGTNKQTNKQKIDWAPGWYRVATTPPHSSAQCSEPTYGSKFPDFLLSTDRRLLQMQSIPSDVIQAFGSATAAAVCNTTSMYVDGKRYWPEGPTDILDPYYLSTAVISLLASMFVVVSFVKFKELRKHPSRFFTSAQHLSVARMSHYLFVPV